VSVDVSRLIGISTRQARELLSQWVRQGWLEVENPSNRARKYRLAEKYRKIAERQAGTPLHVKNALLTRKEQSSW
jgi:DNA-binding transcriptional regulator PaaX